MAFPAPEINSNINRLREKGHKPGPFFPLPRKKKNRARASKGRERKSIPSGRVTGIRAGPHSTPPKKGIRARSRGNFRKSYMMPRQVLFLDSCSESKNICFSFYFFEPFLWLDSFIYWNYKRLIFFKWHHLQQNTWESP
jgi:hypothetical protein